MLKGGAHDRNSEGNSQLAFNRLNGVCNLAEEGERAKGWHDKNFKRGPQDQIFTDLYHRELIRWNMLPE